eukprot:CAMPEP_0197606766 /NCGR_PEP_ID=MMETSP1326-20131121/45736_1 /TAXON_ID=1155430 /ORGANISM="Genus nov. species nov., Strain RCC2288" /LENGTH=86 /DNA_ID=CAMNT_0043174733 /DNA_START=548 /DNA_END=804 /DNA_ORIENTATION=+
MTAPGGALATRFHPKKGSGRHSLWRLVLVANPSACPFRVSPSVGSGCLPNTPVDWSTVVMVQREQGFTNSHGTPPSTPPPPPPPPP